MPISPSAVPLLPAPSDNLRHLPRYIEGIDLDLAKPWSAGEEFRTIEVDVGSRAADPEFRLWPFDIEQAALIGAYAAEGWKVASPATGTFTFWRPSIVQSAHDCSVLWGLGAVELRPGLAVHINKPMTAFCRVMGWPVLHAPEGARVHVLAVIVGGRHLDLDLPDGGLPIDHFSTQKAIPAHCPQPFVREGVPVGVFVRNMSDAPIMISAAFMVDSLGRDPNPAI